MMDEARFWSIIDSSREQAKKLNRPPNEEINFAHEQTLADALSRLDLEDIIAFDARFWFTHHSIYRWDLWGAAYWLHGGCSDDGFADFRACLISLGTPLFNQVLGDPDTLADIADRPDIPYMQTEGFQYIARKVYKKRAGEEMPDYQSEWAHLDDPIGERFDFDDKEVMREHFAKLVAKYPNMGD